MGLLGKVLAAWIYRPEFTPGPMYHRVLWSVSVISALGRQTRGSLGPDSSWPSLISKLQNLWKDTVLKNKEMSNWAGHLTSTSTPSAHTCSLMHGCVHVLLTHQKIHKHTHTQNWIWGFYLLCWWQCFRIWYCWVSKSSTSIRLWYGRGMLDHPSQMCWSSSVILAPWSRGRTMSSRPA